MWLFFFVLAAVITIFLHRRGIFRRIQLASKIRGPSLWKLVTTHTKEVLSDRLMAYLSKTCGDFQYKPWGFWLMSGKYAIIISDPNTCEELYRNKHLINKTFIGYGMMAKYAGSGLLVINGQQWKVHRKIGNRAFRRSLLEANIDIVVDGAEAFVEELRDRADGPAFGIGELLDEKLFEIQIRYFTSNNVASPSSWKFLEAHRRVFEISHRHAVNPLYHWLLLKFHRGTQESVKRIQEVITAPKPEFLELLEDTKSRLANVETPTTPFESLVINTRDIHDIREREDELYQEFVQTITAASEPTATAIQGLILMLALHQDVQQRVFDETATVLEKNQRPTPKDLHRMEYLGMVINESLRLLPPGCLLLRNADEEVELSGVTIPKGSVVILNAMALHRNPDHFDDPLKFKPERFLPKHSDGRHPYSYLPFSSGTRGCIGQVHATNVIKILASHLVRSYLILPAREDFKDVSDVKFSACMTLRIDECDVKLISRDKRGM